MNIKKILSSKLESQDIIIKGWVRTKRGSKNVAFIALNDGSTVKNLQIVAEGTSFTEELLRQITTGSCVSVTGKLDSSKGHAQESEILANRIEI